MYYEMSATAGRTHQSPPLLPRAAPPHEGLHVKTAITTGTSIPLALARAINILRAEHGGPDWDDSTRLICKDAMLLRINQQLADARDVRTPMVPVMTSLEQPLTLFETYWAIGNASRGIPGSGAQPVTSPSPTPQAPQAPQESAP